MTTVATPTIPFSEFARRHRATQEKLVHYAVNTTFAARRIGEPADVVEVAMCEDGQDVHGATLVGLAVTDVTCSVCRQKITEAWAALDGVAPSPEQAPADPA